MDGLKHPEWTRKAVIYQIHTRQFSTEGTFRGIEPHLPRLRELGVSILWLMPIHPIGEKNRKGPLGSPYAVKDYFGVNPELGTMEDFTHLVNAVHALDMKIILGWVPNHTAWDNALTEEHPEWYARNWKGDFHPTPWLDWDDIIDLDYSVPAVREYMTAAMEWWVHTTDIDGFRCDVAMFVPTDFWEETRRRLDAIKPVFMLAEAETKDLHEHAFDMTYAWSWYDAMRNLAAGGPDQTPSRDLSELYEYYALNVKMFQPWAQRMTFLSNHDKNAWEGTQFEQFGPAVEAAIVLSVLGEGIPLIYNGQEAENRRRLSFFDRDPIEWRDARIGDLYRSLIALRKRLPALDNAPWGARMEQVVLTENGRDGRKNGSPVFAFVRRNDQGRLFALLNFSPEHRIVRPADELSHDTYRDFTTKRSVTVDGETLFKLGPWEYRVLVDEP